MFTVTFLGHQGWFFSSEDSHLLIDPLLEPKFGQGVEFMEVFPPRDIDLRAVPPLDAVLFTHEHEDHFNLPSIHKLDRRTPLFLSARSSTSAQTILEEMGFTVRRVKDGDTVRLGGLEVVLFTPDHVNQETGDEWDVLQYLVRDRNGHGHFLSCVDVHWSRATRSLLADRLENPGIWSHTDNSMNWAFSRAGKSLSEKPFTTARCTSAILSDEATVRHEWAPPRASIICGKGLFFTGHREWLNRNVFLDDPFVTAQACQTALPGSIFLPPLPGLTMTMQEGKVTSVTERASFLSARPRAEWPSRTYVGDVEILDEYEPASGRYELTPDELSELLRHLEDFAKHLFGGNQFAGFYSMSSEELGGKQPTFAMALLSDRDRSFHVVEYQPQSCRFVPVPPSEAGAFETYAAGMEMWASDLLGVFRGEIGGSNLIFGGARAWTHFPETLPASARDFWKYFHPLRHPETFLRLYRRILATLSPTTQHLAVHQPARAELITT